MQQTTSKSRMRLLVPGFIFQSIVIGGGYGTGAEIMQYFQVNGFVGGLMGIGVTLGLWSLLCSITFEFSRMFQVYDYNSMMGLLLGRGAVLFEISYIAMMLMVLGAIAASAGAMASELVGVTPWAGFLLLFVCVVLLVTKGTEAVEKALSFWSYILYAVYILFMVICFFRFGDRISSQFQAMEIGRNWAASGAKYAFYNLGCVPLLLYTIRGCSSRKDALLSGLIAGIIGVVPAALLLVVLVGVEGTLGAEVPVAVVFHALDMDWLYWLFEIVLFGTLIETGTGFIKALDDRIHVAIARSGRAAPKRLHTALSVTLAAAGIGVAQLGLDTIIAKGYNAMNWAFLLVYALPMLTRGVRQLRNAAKTG